jgi:pimeloyl-ACP methyl ester carboxylesterase
VPLDVQILNIEQIDLRSYGVNEPGWDIRRVDGTLNGRTFEMIVPYAAPQPYTNSDIGIVLEFASRLPHAHAPAEHFTLGVLSIGRAASGVITIAMHGVTGGHPYVHSAQEAVLASRYLRSDLIGRRHIITTGGSYGGAAAQINAALYPEHFDGVVAVAAPYSGRQFLSWNDANGLRFLGAGVVTSDYLYYSELDGMTMAAAQAGLTLDNLDLTQLGNARVPASILVRSTGCGFQGTLSSRLVSACAARALIGSTSLSAMKTVTGVQT